MLEIILVVLGIVLDQVTKFCTVSHIQYGTEIKVIDSFFSLAHVVNRGAAWSFLAGHDWGIYILSAISVLAFIFLMYVLCFKKNGIFKWPLALIAAGCGGNMIDRVLYHGVVDMLSFRFGSYHFPVFNFADTLLVIGMFWIVYLLLFTRHADSFTFGKH